MSRLHRDGLGRHAPALAAEAYGGAADPPHPVAAAEDAGTQSAARQLSAARLALIARLSRPRAAVAASGTNAAAPADRARPFPLSLSQHGVWVSEQLSSTGAVYNVPGALRLNGVLNVEALRRSFAEVVRRHESLRTSFAVVDGLPVQTVHPDALLPLPLCDLSGVGSRARQEAADGLLRAEAWRPFRLDTHPLLRVFLIRLRDREHVLSITMHHLICDGWSMRVLLDGFSTGYNALASGRPIVMPEPAKQYRDYVSWQQQRLESGALAHQLSYWKSQLGTELTPLRLPVDRNRVPDSQAGGAYRFRLEPSLVAGLRAVARAEGVTMFVTLLAAFKVLLHRYTRQPVLLVGTDVANRRPEFKDVIGLFSNQVLVRTSFEGNPSFRGIVRRVQQVVSGALVHQDLPFGRLVQEINPERDPRAEALVTVKFVFEEHKSILPHLTGLAVEFANVPKRLAKFDLTLFARAIGSALVGVLEYKAGLFEPTTIVRMIAQLATLIEALVEQPDVPLAGLRVPVAPPPPRRGRGGSDTFRAIKPRTLRVPQVTTS